MHRIALLFLVTTLLGACTRVDEPLIVWSNIPETAFLVERYNFVHDGDVRFRFVENLTERFTQDRPEADVIIGRWVNTPPVNALMREYDEYLHPAADRPPIDAGAHWIALSFNLPAVAALPDVADRLPDFSLSLEDISRLYDTDTPPVHFAPTADPEGIYALHRSLGFVPGVDTRGTPGWDDEELRRALSLVREWRTEYNGSLEHERTYRERYLYERPFQQLEKRRISLVYFGSEELFTWRFFGERDVAFRWLSSPDGRLYANENVVYGGVPSASNRSSAAARFLTWVMRPDTQISIMRNKLEARIESFGFLEGLSTHEAVNRHMEIELYPELAGRLPHPGGVTFSGVLPRYWNEARTDVVEPYFRGESDSEDLSASLSRWYQQRGD